MREQAPRSATSRRRPLWWTTPAANRRWVVVNALGVTAVINLVLNAGIAWASIRGQHNVPVWSPRLLGRASVLSDTVGTLFLLPLITTLLCTTAVWREIGAGRLPPLDGAALGPLGHLPPGRLRRGFVLGALALVVLSPVVVTIAAVADVGALSRGNFILYKALFAVLLGAVVTPLIALGAMGDVPPGDWPVDDDPIDVVQGRHGSIELYELREPVAILAVARGIITLNMVRQDIGRVAAFGRDHREGWSYLVDIRGVRLLDPRNVLELRRVRALAGIRHYVAVVPGPAALLGFLTPAELTTSVDDALDRCRRSL
jgi:hypothetical protein